MGKIFAKSIKCRLYSSNSIKLNTKKFINFYDYYEIKSKEKRFLITNFKNSPHFKSLNSKNFEKYEKYIKLSNQKDHSLEQFNLLLKNFDESLLEEFKIELKQIEFRNKKFYLIIDGLHRVSIYFYLTNQKYLPTKYIKIN